MSGDTRDEFGGVVGDSLPPECAAVSGDLAELALGTLTGRERVAALAHLENCARCSAEVEALSVAADQLLLLAPAAEPPVGFEAGVFERLGFRGQRPRRPAWLTWRPQGGRRRRRLRTRAGLRAGSAGGPRDYERCGPLQRPGCTRPALSNHCRFPRFGQSRGRARDGLRRQPHLDLHGHERPPLAGDTALRGRHRPGPTVVLGRFWLSEGKGAWAASVEPTGRAPEPGPHRERPRGTLALPTG